MSETSKAKSRKSLVSSVEADSLEFIPPNVTSPQSPLLSPIEKDQPSLQDLIDAELVARLQPDSLEGPYLVETHDHTVSVTNEDTSMNCSVSLDSLNQSHFSMDSLMESSKVDMSHDTTSTVKFDDSLENTGVLDDSLEQSNDSIENVQVNGSSETQFSGIHESEDTNEGKTAFEEPVNATTESLLELRSSEKSEVNGHNEPEEVFIGKQSVIQDEIKEFTGHDQTETSEEVSMESVVPQTITYTIESATETSEESDTESFEANERAIPSFSAAKYGINSESSVPIMENDASDAYPVIDKESPVIEDMVAEETPVVDSMVAEETPVVDSMVAEETPVMDSMVAEETPVVDSMVTEETSVVDSMVTEETPIVDSKATEETPVINDLVTEETPIIKNLVTEETPVIKNLVDEGNPVVVNGVAEKAPVLDNMALKASSPVVEDVVPHSPTPVNGISESSSSVLVDVTNTNKLPNGLDVNETQATADKTLPASVCLGDDKSKKKKNEEITNEEPKELESEPPKAEENEQEQANESKENSDEKQKPDGERKKKKKKKGSKGSRKRRSSCSSSGVTSESDFTDHEFSTPIIERAISPLIQRHVELTESKKIVQSEQPVTGVNFKQLKANYLSVAKTPTEKSPNSNSPEPAQSQTSIANLLETFAQSSSPETSPSKPTDIKSVPPLKNLKSAYEACATRTVSNPPSPKKKEIIPVSITQLKNNYCSAAHIDKEDSLSAELSHSPNDESAVANRRALESTQVPSECRICNKPVFQMEKIVAEKACYHKNCFRCVECSKQLTLETYQSHEGKLYCKPHFKELFRPKAVLQDEAEELREKSSDKPDYGLEELQTLNVKERFNMFENCAKEAEPPKLEHISVQRSQSMVSRAARFLRGDDEKAYREDSDEMDEYDEEYDEDETDDGEHSGEENGIVRKRKKKERPMSFSGIGDLKNAWEQKQRRENMSNARKEEIGKFRQMICAGKNHSLKEMFESGKFEDSEGEKTKEQINIDTRCAAKSLRERFEKGQPFIMEDEEDSETEPKRNSTVGEREEVQQIFKEAETAKKARDVFKNIDSKVAKEGGPVMRSKSFAQAPRENRLSQDISFLRLQTSPSTAEVIKSHEKVEDVKVDTTDLMSRFKFFATFEKRREEEQREKKKVFRMTPPREGVEQGLITSDDVEMGRDPNLIKSSDNYEDEVDCTNTKNILQMFKKLEKGTDEEERGPRPLKSFTPPPGAEDYGSGSESDDEEYTDEDYTSEDEEDSDGKPKYKDEILEMLSARKAASLRAKFEKYEDQIDEQNAYNGGLEGEDSGEEKPNLDTARNLKAMFEHKAIEVAKPQVKNTPVKVNRFVGGGGEKCVACSKTVYAMEKLEIVGKILHKNCFKCTKCNTKLSMGSFSIGGDKMYCTTHYKQLFTEKGSYDAFSDTINWTRKIEATNGDVVKSQD